jgi:hypothetical protein
VRVAADDGHAGLGEAELGADDVDDALIARVDIVELDAEFGAVFAQRGNLRGGDGIEDVEAPLARGGYVVVDRGNGAVGAANLAASEAKTLEGLRGSDLVDELEVDIEDGGLALQARRPRAAARPFRRVFAVMRSLMLPLFGCFQSLSLPPSAAKNRDAARMGHPTFLLMR